MTKFFTRKSADGQTDHEFAEWQTHNGTAVEYVTRLQEQHPDIWKTLEKEYQAWKAEQPVPDAPVGEDEQAADEDNSGKEE